jgi:6-phosphogluconate dehydrogenase
MILHMDIGLIGLGVMGENLASNFIRNGFSVAGFDRSHERSAHFSRMTADRTACSTPSAAKAGCEQPGSSTWEWA